MDKIICLGKNYLEHARELNDNIPEKPVVFLKPPSVLKRVNHFGDTLQVTLPKDRGDVHYECEIVLQLGMGGSNLTLLQATHAICAVSLGLDMTLRAEQAVLKQNGHPWTISKVFDGSAIVGPLIPISTFSNYMEEEFLFSMDGNLKQQATGTMMRMKPIEIVMYLSRFFPLCEGDLIFTGTPAGVGPVGETASITWGKRVYFVNWLS